MPKLERKKTEVFADSLEALADNVAEISKLGRAIKRSPLSERAIILLIYDMTDNVTMDAIKKVLHALPELEKQYLKR